MPMGALHFPSMENVLGARCWGWTESCFLGWNWRLELEAGAGRWGWGVENLVGCGVGMMRFERI